MYSSRFGDRSTFNSTIGALLASISTINSIALPDMPSSTSSSFAGKTVSSMWTGSS